MDKEPQTPSGGVGGYEGLEDSGEHSNPANFLLENIKIQCNVIEAAWRFGVHRLSF